MTDRELMQQALDALDSDNPDIQLRAATALRARLAQPEPEPVAYTGNGTAGREADVRPMGFFFQMPKPVAWHEPGAYGNVTVYKDWAKENGWLPLYATPPRREWQGLTDEQIQQIEMSASSKLSAIYLAEAQLKGKNT